MLTLPNAFGIIKSPGFPSNPYGNPKGCFWAIVPGRNQFVEVTIHVLFSRDSARFLHITYTDCPTEKVEKKDYCCMTTKPSIVQKSCGALYIRHNQYPAGEEHGNRFVISYQGNISFPEKNNQKPILRYHHLSKSETLAKCTCKKGFHYIYHTYIVSVCKP